MCVFTGKKSIMEHQTEVASPSMQDILGEMEKSHTYTIFSETWKIMNIINDGTPNWHSLCGTLI